MIMREVWENGKGFYRGSIRGLDKSELPDFRQFLIDSGLVEFVEGHSNAAGVSIPIENLSKLNEYANEKLANVNFNEGIYEADFIEDASTPIAPLINEIGHADMIWGKGVEEPWIVIEGLIPRAENIQLMGANKDSVKWTHNGVCMVKFKDKNFIEVLKNLESG